MDKRRVFVITEREYRVICEKKSMTHYRFVNNIGNFLEALLQNPINSKPSDSLELNGLGRRNLLKELIRRGIVKRDSRIDDKTSDKPMFKVKYTVPREGLLRKVNKFYMDYFGESIDINKKPINEDGEGGGAAMSGGDSGSGFMSSGEGTACGATGCSTVGGENGFGYVQPLSNQIITQGSFYGKRKTKKKNDK